MATEFTLECNHCGHNFNTKEHIEEDDYYDTGVSCPMFESCITYVMKVYERSPIPLKNKKKEPPYPPLPPKEKTDRELILELLQRLEKVEEKLK